MNDRASQLRARLIRNIESADAVRETREPLYDSLSARLSPGTAARKLGASVDTVPPGQRSCPYHFHHAQEEMFVVLEGCGSLRVAGEMLAIVAGDVIFIPPGPEYPHQIINTSQAPLRYLSIGTRESPEIVEYPDSRKFLAVSVQDGTPAFRTIQHQADSVDYWAGEP